MIKSSLIVKFVTIALILISVVALYSACGPGKATPAPTPSSAPTPTGNQPPIISSLTPSQTQVYPSGTVEIQCIASDPNGDKLNFTWSATGGTLNGAGEIVTWQAPKQYGTYTITVTADDGKGASAQSSVTLGVGANQNPQISSLVADPSVIGPGGSSLITCIANDPDGDVVKYNWHAIEGNITGVGNKVTWFPPNKGGAFNITVTVSDGKGGETQGNVAVTVATATKTVTINIVQEETGSVDSTGDKDNSKTRAGDDDKNVGYRAFWSFNIWSLNGTEVKDAKLIFTTRSISGNPFLTTGAESLGGLKLWTARYADKLPDFNTTGSQLQKAIMSSYEPPTVIDVTPEVVNLVQAGATRFQVEALFEKIKNGNNKAEWIEWSEVKLEVTYTEQ